MTGRNHVLTRQDDQEIVAHKAVSLETTLDPVVTIVAMMLAIVF